MLLEVLPKSSLVLAVSLATTIVVGCAPGWACGARSSGGGCFCTSEEVLTPERSECNATETGTDHCCDDAREDLCSCRPAPSCWIDGEACACGRERPSGTAPADRCVADPGLICCDHDGAVDYCICGFVECPFEDDRVVTSCAASDVDVCDPGEVPVTDCVLRE
jgi:hypothetical protein